MSTRSFEDALPSVLATPKDAFFARPQGPPNLDTIFVSRWTQHLAAYGDGSRCAERIDERQACCSLHA